MSNGINFFPPTQEELDATSAKGKEASIPGTIQKEIVGEMDVVPVRNQPGFKNEVLGIPVGRTAVNLSRGLRKDLVGLGDFFLNAPIQAMKYAGVIPNDADENYLNRIFMSEDYEKQLQLIPYLLYYGQGRKGTGGDTTGDKIVEGIGEGIGMSIPFLALTARSVKGMTDAQRLASPGSSEVTSTGLKGKLEKKFGGEYEAIKRSFTEFFEKNPGFATKVELGAGGVSGLGLGVERGVFGSDTGIGGLLPLTPLAIPALYKISPLKKGIDYIGTKTKPLRESAVEQSKAYIDEINLKRGADALEGPRADYERSELADRLNTILQNPKIADEYARTAEIEKALLGSPTNVARGSDELGGSVPFSPAEATGERTLIQTQKSIESKGSPEFVDKNIERKYSVLALIKNFMDDTVLSNTDPSKIQDAPLYIIDRLNNRYTSTIANIDKTKGKVVDQIDAIQDTSTGILPKITSKTESGQNIRAKIKQYYDNVSKQTDKLARDLKINENDVVSDPKTLQQAQKNVKDITLTAEGTEALSYKNLPPVVKDFVSYNKTTISFQDWKRFSGQVSQQLGKAIARGNSEDIQVLKALQVQLRNMVDNFPGAGENLKQFNKFYKETTAPIYESAVIKKVLSGARGQNDEIIRYETASETVANAFLKDSKTVQDYKLITNYVKGQNSDDVVNLRNAALDKIRLSSLEDRGKNRGLINPDKLNKALNKNKDWLEEIPGKDPNKNLYEELVTENKTLDYLTKRNALLDIRKNKISNNKLYKKIATVMDEENPEKLIDDALKDMRLLKEIKTKLRLGTDKQIPDEVKTFNSLVGSRIFKDMDSIIANPGKFKQTIDNNEKIFTEAMGKEHYDNLKIIADAYEKILITGDPEVLKASAGIIKPTQTMEAIADATGTSVASIQARIIAVAEGRISKITAATYLASRLLSKNQSNRADAIFAEAMFDPYLAKQLAKTGGFNPKGELIFEQGFEPQRLRAYLFGLGLSGVTDTGPGEKEEVIFKPIPKTKEELSPPYFEEPEPKPSVNPRKGITPDIFKGSQITPPPTPNTTNVADVGSLFPNDATAMAIAKRRTPQAGIGTLPT